MLNFSAREWMFNVCFFFFIIITFPLLLLPAPSLHLPRPSAWEDTAAHVAETLLWCMCVCVYVLSQFCVCVCSAIAGLKRLQWVIAAVRFSLIAFCRVAASGGDHRHRCGSFCCPYRLHRNHRGVLLHPFTEKYAKLFVSSNIHWRTRAWLSAHWEKKTSTYFNAVAI